MYEHMPAGLGWETLYQTNWYGGQTETPKPCIELAHRGVPGEEAEQRCFRSTSTEQSLAVQSECERIGWNCETRGEPGSTWCCPPGRPGRQVTEGEVIFGEPDVTVIPSTPPVPIHRRTFLSTLSHPGALIAIGVVGVAGLLGYRALVRQEGRFSNV